MTVGAIAAPRRHRLRPMWRWRLPAAQAGSGAEEVRLSAAHRSTDRATYRVQARSGPPIGLEKICVVTGMSPRDANAPVVSQNAAQMTACLRTLRWPVDHDRVPHLRRRRRSAATVAASPSETRDDRTTVLFRPGALASGCSSGSAKMRSATPIPWAAGCSSPPESAPRPATSPTGERPWPTGSGIRDELGRPTTTRRVLGLHDH